MAAVIRVGGSDPLVAKTWEDALKLALLEILYDKRSARESDIPNWLDRYLYTESIEHKYEHVIRHGDIRPALRQMLEAGWIRVDAWKCTCCANANLPAEEVMNHAVSFRLTETGYSKVPEHIVP